MSLRNFGLNELYFMLLSVRWTVLLSLVACFGGGALGLLVAALRVAPSRLIRRATGVYIVFFQGTPILVQLLLAYYGTSFLGFTPDAWLAASLTFVLNSSAFFGEIWRGCIAAVPSGQWESARALGLRYVVTLRLVVLPQALRLMVAPTIGFVVQIVKTTSVASLIGIVEITRAAVMVNTVTFEPLRVFGTVCAVYFVICSPLSYASRKVARRLGNRRAESAIEAFRVPRRVYRRAVMAPLP
jgi:polar amino acid transport system permease protein